MWDKRADAEELRQIAALFKARLKRLVLGAFGVPNEAELAAARDKGQLVTQGQPATGAALWRVAKSRTAHTDFAGRAVMIGPGDIHIRSLVAQDGSLGLFLAQLVDMTAPRSIFLECFIEDRALVQELEAQGFRLALTKVAAASELKGLFALERKGRIAWPEPLAARDRPVLAQLAAQAITEARRQAILQEALAFGEFAQHYSSYNKRKSWTAIALHGYDAADPLFIIKPREMSVAWQQANPLRLDAKCGPTVALEKFPETARLLESWVTPEVQRVRIMALEPGEGELTRHADITDLEAGTAPGRVTRLHIPLQTAEGCVFRGWELDGSERRVHMAQGSLWYLDQRKPHAVVNASPVRRLHLVIDSIATEELGERLAATQEARL